MQVWHLTPDAPRRPDRVRAGATVELVIGTWPVEDGQEVWVDVDAGGARERVQAAWERNQGPNSFWRARIGPFRDGDRVRYDVTARRGAEVAPGPTATFTVGRKLRLALLWHQHQPLYRDTRAAARGSYRQPWARLHALRDYHGMAALVAERPGVHLTINLTPVLLWQLDDYVARGATDGALELTLRPAETMTDAERDAVVGSFFDADWRNQIRPHPRYRELFDARQQGRRFDLQALRDLQMWFNLAWFAPELRAADTTLVTGERVAVRRFVEQGRGFSPADLEAMVAEQYKVMRAVVPLHRALQERGQIELSVTPFFHPILPLLIDTDAATVDRPGATMPRRFHHPEDAEAQLRDALEAYRGWFGVAPRGAWPAEGAVSTESVAMFADAGLAWLATGEGVLARSDAGHRTEDPDVLCRPYRFAAGGPPVHLFFRDTVLADEIGFHLQGWADPAAAAGAWIARVKDRARGMRDADDAVVTVVLDGENAWGGYADDGRPFLRALYEQLERDEDVETATFSECVAAAPGAPRVEQLFTASWIDENGSLPGAELGTWIGEVEENRAWELLGDARDALERAGVDSPEARLALHAAEGSDWFWWFGEDQDSGHDWDFDELFRLHVANVYRALGREPPEAVGRAIVPRTVYFRFASPVAAVRAGDRLTVEAGCPGVLRWRRGDGPEQELTVEPVGGVMSGGENHQATLGPLDAGPPLWLRFECRRPGCASCPAEAREVFVGP
jgi:alpha-amylase/alpha-mannosidase (GH57 family)